MTTTDTVRRHPDGSIDFDFYRAGATALRRQAMEDAFKLKSAARLMALSAAALAVATLIAWAPGSGSKPVATAASQPIDCSTSGAAYDPSSPCWLLPLTEQARRSKTVAGRMVETRTPADPI
jgi:hypothetical protein